MKQTLVGDRNRGEIKIGKTDIIDESDDRSHRATKPHRFTAEKVVEKIESYSGGEIEWDGAGWNMIKPNEV